LLILQARFGDYLLDPVGIHSRSSSGANHGRVPPMATKGKKRPLTDAERHKRFVDMAREVGASDKAKDFDKAFRKVVTEKPKASKKR
jgi:hypothetical protein